MKNVRKQVENEVQKQLKTIMAEVKAIRNRIPKEPTQYTDKRGEIYCECPGAYNDYMSRAMASDMFWFYPMFQIKYPELSEHVIDWTKKMTNRNYQLMRMFDDDEGNRPMQPWSEKTTCRFMDDIRKAFDIAWLFHKKNHDPMLKDFLDRSLIWTKRVMYMDVWAFYLQNLEDIDQILFYSQIEIFDNNGNKISGLDENKQVLIKALCAIRTDMTKLLVSVPVDSDDHRYLMDKVEIFDQMGLIIMKEAE